MVPACFGGGSGDDGGAPTLSPASSVSNPLGECARNTRIGTVYDEASEAAFEQGVTLAADQLSSRGSFNYEPVFTDGAGDATQAEAATAELASDETVSAIVSTAAAGAAGPSADAARQEGVAFIASGASPDELRTGDGVFSLRLSARAEIAALKQTVRAQLGFRGVIVIRNDAILLQEGSGYVLAPDEGQDPGALLRILAGEVGPGNIVGTSIYASIDTGALPDGVHIGVPWHVETPESINFAFVTEYEEAYGDEPTIQAAYGYTSVLLVARAVEDACSNERADVIAGLAETKDAPSVFGRFSLSPTGEPSHPMWLLQVKRGTLTPPKPG
jgi:ABC-type branched-subunit amino acid transport system substrate-binding protein